MGRKTRNSPPRKTPSRRPTKREQERAARLALLQAKADQEASEWNALVEQKKNIERAIEQKTGRIGVLKEQIDELEAEGAPTPA